MFVCAAKQRARWLLKMENFSCQQKEPGDVLEGTDLSSNSSESAPADSADSHTCLFIISLFASVWFFAFERCDEDEPLKIQNSQVLNEDLLTDPFQMDLELLHAVLQHQSDFGEVDT